MAYLTGVSGNQLTSDDGADLLTDDLPAVLGTPTAFPLMLALRLFIHAAWLLFMLIPS